ncbi:MAG: substrate-binding domain-containing protein, partial [Brevinematales bacterium]|nr:substrate-binding domain-containing protein [Brevinematales bacterium]
MNIKRNFSKDMPLIGVLINQIDGRYQSILYKGMSDYAMQNSMKLIFFVGRALNSPYPGEQQYNSIYELAKSEKIDGLVIASGSLGNYLGNEELSKYLKDFPNIPKVSLSFKFEDIPGIFIDNYSGMKNLLEHLIIKHGYRKIAYISGPNENFESQERFKAYKETLHNFGLSFREELVFKGDFSYQSGHSYSQQVLKGSLKDFDVIVCANDEMAIGLIEGIGNKTEVLERLRVTGFDDVMEAKSVYPSLTTVRVPIYEQGYLSCKIITEMINGIQIENDTYLGTKIVVRESCGCFDTIYQKYTYFQIDEESKNNQLIINHSFLIKIIGEYVDVKENEKEKFNYFLENILDALSFDLINKPQESCFIKELNFAFQLSLDFLYFGEVWQTVLIILREYFQKNYKNDNFILTYSNDLIQKGEIVLAKWIEKKASQYSYELYGLLYNLRQTVRKFNTVFSMKTLLNILIEELLIFNVKNFYLCLFDEVQQKIELSTKVKILLSYNSGSSREEISLFNAGEILPSKNFDKKSNIFVAMSICNRNSQFGYIIFSDTKLKFVVYEFFREQIGSAISSVKLFEEKEKNTNELKKILSEIKESESKFREMVLMLP